jgi:adenylate cyclase
VRALEVPPLERKLAAILAADVEGYSRLMHADEEATLATLTTHRAIIDSLIAAGHGRISGAAGDSVLAEFASVSDAVHCAVAIQQALHKANAGLPEERRMYLRIGINVGDVMVKDGDIFGDGVNVAARLEALAHPGGICVTRGVRDHVQDRVAYGFDDMGEQAVKNIARPVRVFRIVFDPNATTELLPAVSSTEREIAPQSARRGTPEITVASDETTMELAFWSSVQSSGDPLEYQAYLDRYPKGAFAALAHTRLENSEASPIDPEEREVELAFWDTVKSSDNPDMLRAYLDRFPNGEFKVLADLRLAEMGQTR